ncbi:DUF3027 domain-containing protein [Kocuria tytonicola]|uniref:DUF3027 domain-containing protein n=1 Tax=Kocuria tytonicola TaxID=2055946 RepID=A0A3L9L714_9MICC|nr:DUF3027 domain-containing protein [Kocuria tytonicola]RLY92182.1 DUF3027 domain-containing protein [Kocuria tytonicola]RLZ03753.1 DUF3027 domain-containing protein [Kocuria tytonicola]
MPEPTTSTDASGAGVSTVGGAETGTSEQLPAARTRAKSRSTPRARAPKQDPVLTEAVALAREAVVLGGADAAGVGEHVGVRVHEDRLLTHLFDCELPGYPGWTWYATVARAPRSKHVTVCESGLLSGPSSLLAPDWVPWEERMQSVREQDAQEQGDQDQGEQGLGEQREARETTSRASSSEDDPSGSAAASNAPEESPSSGGEEATDEEPASASAAPPVGQQDPFNPGAGNGGSGTGEPTPTDSTRMEDGASS